MKHARIPRHLWSVALAGAFALATALGPQSGTRAGAQPAPPPPPLPNPSLTAIPTDSPTPLPSGVPVPTAAPSAGPPTASPTAAPSATPGPRRRGRRGRNSEAASPAPAASTMAPEPTATPTSPAFATLDGTWEVQLQYIDHTEYSYLTLKQATGGALTGTWHLSGKKAPTYPLTGTYDGRLIRIDAAQPAGPVAFTGYVEGASDMIGLANFGASAASVASAAATPSATTPVAPMSANDGVAFTAEHRGAPNRNILKR